ncbi:MAG: 2-succinyl-5-enolpyruvyl-6-hydroxy-3-cyclohexene-1-carboxylic-acid synthase [Actinomycetota bacterium]|nr:2-succinyl-5-enolpyruvyl-6-hydroxy-3-cyclohexene-1-carboxylic-acid synthase [Actinomycetota bacterium]
MTQASQMSPADVQATFCATLVDQWARMGMRQAVIAPGSRSTPMALALAARADLAVHVVHDERSAAFMALGIGLATGAPAALLCTSGTAATHFHAAVVEADLSGVPLLVLTADRPPELQGIGAPQTIDQIDLYGGIVRRFADAGVPVAEGAPEWREMAEDLWMSAVGTDPGPVHVNLPFREPLVGMAGSLPPEMQPAADGGGDWFMMRPDLAELAAMLEQPRGVIVAGGSIDDPEAVEAFAAAVQWPVLADPRSGCRHLPQAVCCFDSLLRHPEFAAAHTPTVVLHLGEPPASKVLGQWLQTAGAMNVQVHVQQRTIDPLGIVDERVYGAPGTVCTELAPLMSGATGTPWLARWQHAERRAQAALDTVLAAEPGLSEPAVARVLSGVDAHLVLSSSMPVRDVEWFGRGGVRTTVHSNRGANGIDGVIATGIGVAAGSGAPTVVLIGDVAFCHDQSSLTALAGRHLPLTIVVTDNDGGGIFSFLPQATTLPAERFEQLFGTPHGTDLVALAAAHGLGACTVTSEADLVAALADPTVTVVRVRSDRAANVEVHQRLHTAVVTALA